MDHSILNIQKQPDGRDQSADWFRRPSSQPTHSVGGLFGDWLFYILDFF